MGFYYQQKIGLARAVNDGKSQKLVFKLLLCGLQNTTQDKFAWGIVKKLRGIMLKY